MFGYITIISITLLMIVLGIIFLIGKGAFLIAGYNTMSAERKKQYNEQAIVKFMGKLMFFILGAFLLIFGSYYLNESWLSTLGVALIFIGVLGSAIYVNTADKFKKKDYELSDGELKPTPKWQKTLSTCILIVVLIGSGVLVYFGNKDPEVTVNNNSIQISGMYGTTIDFADIDEVRLLNESMREIGVGTRTNGFGGIGDSLKGNFNHYGGDMLLFVRIDSVPTIGIYRTDDKPIFLSFKDPEETRRVYEMLKEAVQ